MIAEPRAPARGAARVLVFLPCLTLGGAERQGLLVARYLKERGHQVEVWGFPAPHGRPTLVGDLRDRGLAYEELSSWPTLAWDYSRRYGLLAPLVRAWKWSQGRRRLEAELPRRTFDVIVPFTFWPSLAACLMRERPGSARCIWNHRGGYDGAGILYDSFLKGAVLKSRPAFLANSRAGARFLSDTFGLGPAEVTIIPNAHAPERDAARARTTPAPPASGGLSLIHVANFYPEKDYDTLLQGMRLLAHEGVACTLHVCGEFLFERDQARFVDLVGDLGLRDRVVHHGPTARAELLDLISRSDIGLLSSRSEGQPNSVMEYMYAGLPVVGTRIPGIQELVGESNERWLFDVGDPKGLARSIGALAEDPALRSEIGRLNHLRIVEHYSPEHVLPRWAELVERLVP